MKPVILSTVLLIFLICSVYTQDNVPVLIRLKDGSSVDAHHFGQLSCNKSKYFDSYIMLRGKYEDIPMEMNDYKNVSKMVLIDFNAPPIASLGNQKGRITVYKKNGVIVDLVEAELSISCFDSDEKYNRIKVQIMNPLTEELVERTIEVRDIETIVFK
jgi:hypothetical protein